MRLRRLHKTLLLMFALALTVPQVTVAGETQYSIQDYYIYEPGPVKQSTLYIDGSTVEFETGILISPVTGSDMSSVTPPEWRDMARKARETFESAPNKIKISDGQGRQGLDVVFNCVSTPPEAAAALESVATYLENLFTDTATVTVNISFAALGPGILGMAQSYVAGNPSWEITRASLVSDMDADDSIQLLLPTGSTIPIRYSYGSETVTNEDRVYFLVAPYNAVIANFPSLAAQITFSTNFSWDYEPGNGVNGFCFQSVAAHEIGHVLGFTSNADGYSYDIDEMDIYRFQRSDGGHDYNPDDWSEFGTTARMVDASPGSDDANSDLIAVEYQMSDTDPYQASHFSQGNVDAIMQPATGSGTTFYPNFFRVADRDMFDAIGWDYILNYYLTTTIIGHGSLARNPDTCWFPLGTPVQLQAIPDSGWMFYQWGGALSGSNNPDTVIMDDDIAVSAYFLSLYVTLTININGSGTVNLDPNLPQYPRNSQVILTAVPDSGWTFSHWGGNLWGSQNPDTLIMNENKTVDANFIPMAVEENKLNLSGGNYFEISPNPTKGMTEIRYMIHDAGYTEEELRNSNFEMRKHALEIYDATGRLVKSFRITPDALRPTQINWDGKDQADRQVGNGVYFVKLQAGDYRATRKLLLLR